MLEALNAIVDFFNMIVNVVQQMIYFAILLPQYVWKSFQFCQSVLTYIPQPFLGFAVATLVISIAFTILRIIHG